MFAPGMHPTEATIASRYAAARAPTPAHHRSWQPTGRYGVPGNAAASAAVKTECRRNASGSHTPAGFPSEGSSAARHTEQVMESRQALPPSTAKAGHRPG
jgi:hypothetical protein